MTTMLDVNRKLRELIRLTLGMPANSVRPANQHSPAEGTEQFASVLVINVEPTGWDDSRFENTPLTITEAGMPVKETIIGQRKIVASVQFFRDNAYEQAMRLGVLLQSSAAQERMELAGFGLIRATTAKDLSAVANTLFEPRGQIDLELHLISSESAQTPTFGTFTIQAETQTLNDTREVTEP